MSKQETITVEDKKQVLAALLKAQLRYAAVIEKGESFCFHKEFISCILDHNVEWCFGSHFIRHESLDISYVADLELKADLKLPFNVYNRCKLLIYRINTGFFYPVPLQLLNKDRSVIVDKTLKPRHAHLQRTIARLQQEINNETTA